MVEVKMIDTMGYGIFRMTTSQRSRYLPLPDYQKSSPNRVVLEVLGRPIDERYSQMLLERGDLDIDTVILLDRVQKRLPITDEAIGRLRREKLIEGKRPNIHVAAAVAEATGTQTMYAHTKGMDKWRLKQTVLDYLDRFKSASKTRLEELLAPSLAADLSEKQKQDRVKNLLSEMSSKDRTIKSEGRGPGAVWTKT